MVREKQWDKRLQLLLVLIVGFNVLPHVTSIPVWASAIAFILLGWKVLSLVRGVPRPPRWFLWLTTTACSFGVFAEYHTIFGQETASALLVTLASAKLLETNRYRDAMFVIFTSFFLLMAHLLDSQSILSTVFMAVDVMLITALMFQLHKQERRQSARSFRPVIRLLGLAIPVWIFLFIIFPRFSAGFWGMKEAQSAASGFSDNLDPGGIESLTDSEEPAFRVTFVGKPPAFGTLYWRGGILTEANGLIWSKAKERSIANDVLVPESHQRQASSYKIYLEPRFQSWVFALDYPESLTGTQGRNTFRRRPGFIFDNLRSNGGTIAYEATSVVTAPAQRLLDEERAHLLTLPSAIDPRITALAAKFSDEARRSQATPTLPTIADRIGDRAIEWFMDQHFGYTKTPGALHGSGPEQLAEFLFTTKRGFCEHYAAAFATLMRAAGVPARVTIGFMGASRNEFADYFIVRDLDAHAWTEIWRDDPDKKGIGHWVRVDPTGFIAPLRIQMGGDFNLLDPANSQSAFADAERRLSDHRSRLFYKAALAWDAVQMKWNSFLTDYDFEFQKSFLENFGLKNMTRWTLFSMSAFGVLLFSLIMNLVLRKRAKHIDPVLLSWRRLCQKLERAGVSRSANEGPLDFTERAARLLPRFAPELQALGQRFAEIRYGDSPSASDAKLFRQSVRQLSLK